jgi:tetratricopeptide (TPR) repeat protein
MMKRLLLSVTLVFLTGLFCFQVYAQTNRISGMVLSKNNSPVSELWVLLLNDVGSILKRTKTDGSGRYMFTGMSGGKFTIRVITSGTDYQEQSQEAEIINFRVGNRTTSDNLQVDFYLRPSKNPNANRINQVIFAQEVPKEAETMFQKALSSLEAKQTQQGIDFLEKAVTVFPTYFLALERLGVELLKINRFKEAQEVFAKSTKVNPASYQSWYGLAFANSALNSFSEAVIAGKKAVEINAESVDGLFLLGISLRSDKKYSEAAEILLKAKKLDKSKNANISWNLALLYFHNLKLYKETAIELANYLKLVPELPKEEVEKIQKLIAKCRELAEPS